MNTEPNKPEDCEDEDQDEVTAAHSIMMDIIEETESEDFGKERPVADQETSSDLRFPLEEKA